MQTIKPIKTEADYTAALAEVNRLRYAAPETPAADRLEVLVTLIDAYEAKEWCIAPPDPIEVIKFRMEQPRVCASRSGVVPGGGGDVHAFTGGTPEPGTDYPRAGIYH